MKILILGCNGMAGHLISLYLHEKGHDVTGFARNKSRFVKTVLGDATNLSLVKKTVSNGNYDSVVNCIGILNQFAEMNHEAAVLLNAYLPHYLAKITEETNTQIVHMSTDCVFSGDSGKYKEKSLRDGPTFYDRSKALGELDNSKDITLRNSIVGPDLNHEGIGLLNWFMQQKNDVNGFSRVLWTGQTTLQLAKTIEAAVIQRSSGLYNMVPNEIISKYELLELFNKYIRMDSLKIISQETPISDKSLIRTNFDGFDYIIPSYKSMVMELGEWMNVHKEIYPHYDL